MEAGAVSALEAGTGTPTMAAQLPAVAAKHAGKPALRHKVGDEWRDISYEELGEAVREIALGLVDLGIDQRDRIAILSQTRPEWTLANFGILTAGATSVANELVITADSFAPKAAQIITPGVGWSNTVNDPTNGFSTEYRLDLPAAVASETIASAPATTWALAIATFKPAAGTAPSGAVLDPGFYYLNGNGFAGGGGGICLNGNTLLAKDVTLEFVNRAGFSTGLPLLGSTAALAWSAVGLPDLSRKRGISA